MQDLQVEFGRIFRDLVTLGDNSRERWTRALIDKEEFNIRKDGFSQLDQEEAYHRIEELTNKLGSNLSPSTVTLKQLESRDVCIFRLKVYRLKSKI